MTQNSINKITNIHNYVELMVLEHKYSLNFISNTFTEEYFDGIDRIKKTTTPETTNQVEYYFNINVDSMVNQRKACRGIEVFNKKHGETRS